MMKLYHQKKLSLFKRLATCLLVVNFLATTLLPAAYAQEIFLPAPGAMVHLSPSFNPPILKGIKVYPENPFLFDFILDNGQSAPTGDNEEAGKLVKYFLASLTTPENEMWVNLSPYEKDRIVPERFGQTEMGRDLLAQDYILKQITASLIYPEDELGKKFWDRVYAEAKKKFGTTDIPVNTFNKVWIVPAKAVVYENPQSASAYVVESSLKVMLEEDYVALANATGSPNPPRDGARGTPSDIASSVVREVVIPALTKEVNEGKNFAQLRQIYNSLILAAWYKKKIKDSILSQVYVDQNKVAGVNIDNPNEKQIIYEQYLEAFKKGAYNYIKEEVDSATQEVIPRKYFSGGFAANQLNLEIRLNQGILSAATPIEEGQGQKLQVKLASSPAKADHFVAHSALSEVQQARLIEHMLSKKEHDISELIAFGASLGLTQDQLFEAIEDLTDTKSFRPDPSDVNKWTSFVPTYNPDGTPTGKIKEHFAMRENKDWRKGSAVLIHGSSGKLWLQIRFDGRLDVSAGGAVDLGLDQRSTILKETRQELGLEMDDARVDTLVDPGTESEYIPYPAEVFWKVYHLSLGPQEESSWKANVGAAILSWDDFLQGKQARLNDEVFGLLEVDYKTLRQYYQSLDAAARVQKIAEGLRAVLENNYLQNYLQEKDAQSTASAPVVDPSILAASQLPEEIQANIAGKVSDFIVMITESFRHLNYQQNFFNPFIVNHIVEDFQLLEDKEQIKFLALALNEQWVKRGYDRDMGSMYSYVAVIFAEAMGNSQVVRKNYQWIDDFLAAADPQQRALAYRAIVVSQINHLRFFGLHPEQNNSGARPNFNLDVGSIPLDQELLIGKDLQTPGILQKFILSLLDLSPEQLAQVLPDRDGKPNSLNLTIEDVMMWSLQLAIDPSIYMFSGDGYNDPELENYLERYFGHKVALKDAGAEFLERAFRNESLAKRLPEVEKLIIRAMTTADQAIVAKGGKSAFRFGLQFESLGKALGQEEFWSNSALEMFRDPLVLFVLDQRFIPEDFSHFFKPGARFSPVQKFLKDYEQSSLRPLYVEVYQSKKLAAIFPNLAPVLEAQQSSSPLENGETLQIKSASSSVFPEQNSAYPLPAKWYGNAKTVDDIKALWKGRTDREWVAVGVSEDVLRGVSHRVYFRIGEQQYTLSGFLRSLRLEGEFQQNRIRDGGGSFLITGVDTVKLRVQVHKALSVLARTLRSDANFDGAYEIKVTALKVEPYFPGTINTMRISFIPREHELSLEKLYASTNWMVKLRSLTLDELKSLKEQEERIKREVKSGALVSGLHQAVDFSDRRLSLFALIDAEILIRERFYKAVQDFKTGDQQALDILVNEATYWSYAELQKLIDAANNEEKDSWQKVVGVIDQKYNKKKKQGRFAPNEASDIIAASAAVVNPAVDTKPKGGIDFNADQLNVETRNSGGEIKFQMSPQQLQELQNVPGFTPVIINVQPLNTIQMFLGLKENDENAVELSRK